ncbi:hypothetical protein ABRP83_13775 [Pectobacterium brasiliense]|uniref:hypothetical protein n=1 Tax=Pectobacterium brasiliense TaxID=180957 RepID=UPI0032EDC78B
MYAYAQNVALDRQQYIGWWNNSLRLDGFVRNINSANEHDVILASIVIDDILSTARKRCDQYCEIFAVHFLLLSLNYLEQLPRQHCHAFIEVAKMKGFCISYDELERSDDGYAELRAELRGDY